jgi:hypothetical protein
MRQQAVNPAFTDRDFTKVNAFAHEACMHLNIFASII